MRLFTLLTFCLVVLLVAASSTAASEINGLDLNARSLGLGQSTIAVDSDFAVSGNPAGLGWENKTTFQTSQARLAFDRYGYQTMVTVPTAGALGIRFSQLIVQNTSYYRRLFNPDGTPIIDPVTNTQALQLTYDTRIETLFSMAYGLEIIRGLSFGAEGQTTHVKVGEDYAWGFDGVIGIDARVQENISVGVLIKQINGNWLAWRNPYFEERKRPICAAGIAWTIEPVQVMVTGSIAQSLEWQNVLKGMVGVEYFGFMPLTLRTGWAADHLNLGAGFVWKDINVDYAAVLGGALYDANRITLKLSF